MAIRIVENPKQQGDLDGKRPTVRREYAISDTYELLEAQLAVIAASPAGEPSVDDVGNLVTIFRNRVSVDEQGGGIWKGIVNYEGSTDTVDLHFSFGVQSGKIFTAYECVVAYDLQNGGTNTFPEIPDFGKTIGVTANSVEGCDVEAGVVSFSITKKWRLAILPTTYFDVLRDFTRPRTAKNHAEYVILWKGQTLTFPRGTLRFRGASIKWGGNDEVEITYQFAYDGGDIAADNFTVESSDPIVREGHDHLTFYNEMTVRDARTITTPIGAYVYRVYPYRNFAELDL